jgi:hypothetical protein
MANKTRIPMMVVADNCAGEPDVCRCHVNVTVDDYLSGRHYDLARNSAAKQGFDEPMVVFDPIEATPIRDAAADLSRDNREWREAEEWCRANGPVFIEFTESREATG